jgi:hypothetical protein
MINNSISTTIKKIYNKVGFLEKYGGSLWMTVIIILFFFIAISYYQVYNNIQPLKADWVNQRCRPGVIPFAGLINPPVNMSAFDFTSENFKYCIQSILVDIAGVFLAPFYYLVNVINNTLTAISKSIQAIRSVLDSIRNSLSSVSQDIMGRSLNILLPIQTMLIKVKDMVNKTQGIMTAGLFTLLGVYDTLRASIGAIIQIVVAILISIATLITIFFAIPFGFGLPFAIPLLVMFILIAIPGIMVYIIQVMILKKMARSIPGI